MTRDQNLFAAWVGTGGIAIILAPTGTVGTLIAGVILLPWGVAIAVNYRGLAESMPSRIFWTEWSVARYRRAFAFYAAIGFMLLAVGVYGIAR